mmetsp:Transcript_127216/g.406797  ORF Transcript_127216/g.406797 Transcript_127216/m.406797 type:complete len:253 (+) Transcript_127216:1402-2160(+)
MALMRCNDTSSRRRCTSGPSWIANCSALAIWSSAMHLAKALMPIFFSCSGVWPTLAPHSLNIVASRTQHRCKCSSSDPLRGGVGMPVKNTVLNPRFWVPSQWPFHVSRFCQLLETNWSHLFCRAMIASRLRGGWACSKRSYTACLCSISRGSSTKTGVTPGSHKRANNNFSGPSSRSFNPGMSVITRLDARHHRIVTDTACSTKTLDVVLFLQFVKQLRMIRGKTIDFDLWVQFARLVKERELERSASPCLA